MRVLNEIRVRIGDSVTLYDAPTLPNRCRLAMGSAELLSVKTRMTGIFTFETIKFKAAYAFFLNFKMSKIKKNYKRCKYNFFY